MQSSTIQWGVLLVALNVNCNIEPHTHVCRSLEGLGRAAQQALVAIELGLSATITTMYTAGAAIKQQAEAQVRRCVHSIRTLGCAMLLVSRSFIHAPARAFAFEASQCFATCRMLCCTTRACHAPPIMQTGAVIAATTTTAVRSEAGHKAATRVTSFIRLFRVKGTSWHAVTPLPFPANEVSQCTSSPSTLQHLALPLL